MARGESRSTQEGKAVLQATVDHLRIEVEIVRYLLNDETQLSLGKAKPKLTTIIRLTHNVRE